MLNCRLDAVENESVDAIQFVQGQIVPSLPI